jgi:hypothetical protein
MPTTAAGSVVATMEPSKSATVSGTPPTKDSVNPMPAAQTKTARTASVRMGATSSTSSRTSIVRAAWNSSSGRKTTRNTEALIGNFTSGSAMSLKTSVSGV